MIKILTHEHSSQFKQMMNSAHCEEPFPFFDESHAQPELSSSDIDNLLHPDNQDQTVLFGAFRDEQLIGYIQLDYNLESTKRHKALLQTLYVAPPYRNEGIAQQLVQTLIPYAKEKGIEHIVLSVASNNIAAKIFYNQLGFEFLALEEKARKINGHYIEDHWLIYYT